MTRAQISHSVSTRVASHGFRVGLAFAAIYLIWGSTFLAIRFAIETIPPFFMGGARFAAAGLVLYGFARMRGELNPGLTDIRAAAIIGALMVLFGNGLVIWAEQHVSSGLAAVLVATGPFWLVLLDWSMSGRKPIPQSTIAGLVIGFAGVVALTILGSSHAGETSREMFILSAVVVALATLSWAAGSIYARRIEPKTSLTMLLGVQMLAGGFMLFGAGTITGEWAKLDVASVSLLSAGSLLYLIVFGTLVGYSAYQWLMRVSDPAKVATHGYVNPIVAVFLGWMLAGEPLTPGMLLATATILLGVALINARHIGLPDGMWRRFSRPKLSNNPELAMIARTWQGVVPSEKADAYYSYLLQTGVSACEAIEGNRGVYVMKKEEDGKTRFMFISLWESMDAIRMFAGDNPERAVYFPRDREFLVSTTPNVDHYEVLEPVQAA